MDNKKLIEYQISSSDDDYKQSFKEKCTSEYTTQQIKNIKEVQLWLKEQ